MEAYTGCDCCGIIGGGSGDEAVNATANENGQRSQGPFRKQHVLPLVLLALRRLCQLCRGKACVLGVAACTTNLAVGAYPEILAVLYGGVCMQRPRLVTVVSQHPSTTQYPITGYLAV